MKLNIDSLKEMGAFTGAPVEKEITWKQGDEEFNATVYVRRMSYNSVIEESKAFSKKIEAAAGRIASCICDENGKAVFTSEDIAEGPVVNNETGERAGPLCSELTWALLTVIAEVNSEGKMKG